MITLVRGRPVTADQLPPGMLEAFRNSVFDKLPVYEKLELAQSARWKTFQPGSIVYDEGKFADRLFLTVKGNLSESKSDPVQIFAQVEEGELFGIEALSGPNATYTTTIGVNNPLTTLLEIPAAAVLAVMGRQPEFATEMQAHAAQHAAATTAAKQRRW